MDEIVARTAEYFGNETCRLTTVERVNVAAAVIVRLATIAEEGAMEIGHPTDNSPGAPAK